MTPDSADDGIGNPDDNCPNIANADQDDADSDGVGDVWDNCPSLANVSQADADPDDVSDACDNCPDVANVDQADGDGACDAPCCGAAGPVTPLGLAVGMLLLGRGARRRRVRLARHH